MADPLVVEDVCRFFVRFTLGGREAECIVDMAVTGSTVRASGLFEVGEQILDAWSTGPRQRQSNDLSCQEVAWIDLDSLEGSTGSVAHNAGSTIVWPLLGVRNETSLPSNAALRVNKRVAAIRGLNGGRTYVPGISENDTDFPNSVSLARLANWQTSWNSFFAALNGFVPPVDGGVAFPCVVHQPIEGGASYSIITGYTVLQQIRSQGRRLR